LGEKGQGERGAKKPAIHSVFKRKGQKVIKGWGKKKKPARERKNERKPTNPKKKEKKPRKKGHGVGKRLQKTSKRKEYSNPSRGRRRKTKSGQSG